jgi:HD superfamily phosphohydrolase YqeK
VGQVISKEGHAKISLELAEKKFGKLSGGLIDCIANHGSSKNPKTEEGKIIQLADKLSILQNTKGISFLFSKKKYYKHSLEFLEKVSCDLTKVLKTFKW